MRYLLCRPIGGLNDILNQIAKCFDYARATSRSLVIDTDYVFSTHFKLDFKKIFIPFGIDDHFLTPLEITFRDTASVMPENLPSPNFCYEVEDVNGLGLCLRGTRTILSFDFQVDHPQEVLIHHAYGGGQAGIDALARLTLRAELQEEFQSRLHQIEYDLNFLGVHIRNTDYKSQYQEFIDSLDVSGFKGVFLATDSREVLDYANTTLGTDRVVSMADFPVTQSYFSLHGSVDGESAYDRAVDAVLDLLFLSACKGFAACPLSPGQGATWSGFAVLAYHLRQRPDILRQLISL